MNVEDIYRQTADCADEIIRKSGLCQGAVLVVGCSTSAVLGEKIGTSGSTEIAKAVYDALNLTASEYGVHLAFQCCEHLNRALVVERAVAHEQRLEVVSVVPKPRAGGALASHAYVTMECPIVVEHILADAGIDIGGVLIGMQIRSVAVPLKIDNKIVGCAPVIAAKSRPKLIGGNRAAYE